AAKERKADLNDVVDPHVRNQKRCRELSIQRQALEIGLASKHLKRPRPRVLDGILPAHNANEMNIEALISRIKFHDEMRRPLGAGARENTLAGTAMPGELTAAQVNLQVLEKSADTICASIFR